MDGTVLSDPAVAGCIQGNFVPVLLDVNGAEGAASLKGRGLEAISPVVVVYGKGGKEVDRWTGVPDAKEFLAFLTDVLRGDHFAALESAYASRYPEGRHAAKVHRELVLLYEAIEEETVALAKATRIEEQAEFRWALYELKKRKAEAR